MTDITPLRLIAEDQTDLTVLGACLQDALVPISDIAYLPDEQKLALAVNRFMWELGGEETNEGALFHRTHSLLRIDGVTSLRSRGYDRGDRARILSLLSIRPIDDGLDFLFADDATIRVAADPLHVTLIDMGQPWPTRWRPGHEEG
jgi:hypothetical protein